MTSTTLSVGSACILGRRFDCGLTLLAEPMPHLRSAAFCWQVPGGLQDEPQQRLGLAGLVCEMTQRGAGSRSSRQVIETQDNLGLERGATIGSRATVYSAAMPAASLHDALSLYADILRRPHLPADQLEDGRNLAIQERQGVDDELPSRLMMQLKKMHYGPVVGRSSVGELEDLRQITVDDVRRYYQEHYHPADGLITVAGNFDWHQLCETVEALIDGWPPRRPAPPAAAQSAPGTKYIEHASQQTHIGITLPAVRYGDPGYFPMRAGVGVLGDGMSSRLFTEVRENRGLCYTVSASSHSLPAAGGIFVYAGTTADRAQETLDVSLEVIRSLAGTIETAELERFKVRIQSSIIMEQESSAARAGAVLSDWNYLGRVMSREELEAKIDSVTPDDVNRYWNDIDWQGASVVTLGPRPLTAAIPS